MSDCSCDSSLRARRGVSFVQTWSSWGTDPRVFKAVAAVLALTPLTLTVNAHGVPADGWNVALLELGGLNSVNAKLPPEDSDYHRATVVDANTLLFADLDAAAAPGAAYTSGGKITYDTAVDLSTISGVAFNVYSLSDPATPVLTKACALDNGAKMISLALLPADVTALTEPEYTFALIATANDGTVTAIDDGKFLVEDIGSVP